MLFAPKRLECGRGALTGVFLQSDQSEKTWLFCWNGHKSPGTRNVHRQLLPGLWLWQPSKSMDEVGGRCSCFVWKLSQSSVACRKWRQEQQQTMVEVSSSGLGNSKHTASPNYHAPWFELSIGLSATWVWNSPNRTVLSSSHGGALAVTNSGSHPEHRISCFHNSRQTKQE
jgi:hypothetical protein